MGRVEKFLTERNRSEFNFLVRNPFRRSDSVYMGQHPQNPLWQHALVLRVRTLKAH